MPSHANRLPALLARLPRDGLHCIVRPTRDPSKLYFITARHLKFRPAGGSYAVPLRGAEFDPTAPPKSITTAASASASASGSGSASTPADEANSKVTGKGVNARPKDPKDANKRGMLKARPASLSGANVDVDGGQFLAGGHIWAMRFKAADGEWIKPRPTQSAAQPIKSKYRLKMAWQHVPSSALSTEVKQRMENWQKLAEGWAAKKEKILKARKAVHKEFKVEGRIRWMERTRRRVLRGEEMLRPTIVYQDATVQYGQIIKNSTAAKSAARAT